MLSLKKLKPKRKRLKLKRKRLNRSTTVNVLIFLLLALTGIFMAFPLIFSVLQSIKPLDEIFMYPPKLFVQNPTLRNYSMLFQLTNTLWVPFSRYVFNSVFLTVAATGLHVIFASMAAYPLAKYKFPGSRLMMNIVVLSLLFAAPVTQIPRYIIMAKMGMINTYAALILPPIAGSLGLFLMRQFMTQIPNSFIESAKIDGAGTLTLFWKIVMPYVKPAWLTLIIFAFQGTWNADSSAFIYNESLKILPTILGQIASSGLTRAGTGYAAAVLLLIPPIVTFVIVQSNVVETMAHSGIKE